MEMASRLLEKGREGFLDGTIDWDTNTIKAALLDLDTADTGVKAITGATNATPIVITATAHGFTNGDIVVINKVLGNLAANGVWAITGVATNTFNLTDPISAGSAVGSAAYTSGGYAVCLGPSASGDNLDDFDGCVVGSAVTLGTPTVVSGVAGAANSTFTAVTGASVEAILIYKDTGTASTSRCAAFVDGRQIVTCAAQAAVSATTIAVERLNGAIPNGTILTFSNGASATMSALANAGDRTVTVSSLAAIVTAGSRADAPITGSGLPVTPNGGDITVAWDAVSGNKIFKL
jgi:hypothetical protein